MRGLWAEGGEVAFRDDLPAPPEAEGECRVRVLCAGVCATDLALVRGYMDFRGIPGHEFVGVALDGRFAGARVVGEINAACGRCPTCAAGLARHCPERTVLGILAHGGAFAQELRLPARNLLPVPDGVSTEAATFTEPLAAAFEIAEQVDLTAVRRALVLGDGRLGILCAQVLALDVDDVRVVGHHPERARLLDGRIPWTGEPEPGSADLIVEATGRPEVLARALGWVRPRGTLVLKTTSERPAQLDLAPLVVNEITLLGSRCGPFPRALAALESGEVRVEPLVAARFPLERGPAAFARAGAGGTLKVLVDVAAS